MTSANNADHVIMKAASAPKMPAGDAAKNAHSIMSGVMHFVAVREMGEGTKMPIATARKKSHPQAMRTMPTAEE
jgi:hypothetical protein